MRSTTNRFPFSTKTSCTTWKPTKISKASGPNPAGRPNCCPMSALPWLSFTGMAHVQATEPPFLPPIIHLRQVLRSGAGHAPADRRLRPSCGGRRVPHQQAHQRHAGARRILRPMDAPLMPPPYEKARLRSPARTCRACFFPLRPYPIHCNTQTSGRKCLPNHPEDTSCPSRFMPVSAPYWFWSCWLSPMVRPTPLVSAVAVPSADAVMSQPLHETAAL